MREREGLLYAGAGPLAAILLGMALTPLRGLTTASNLSFAFVALTIVVAEFGGRGAATATALVSALSLDFFLTQPYLMLSMEDKHDVIAFVGLAACGLVAAALGSQGHRRTWALEALERRRDLQHALLCTWDAAAPEPPLQRLLSAALDAYPLAGAAVRDANGDLLASASSADAQRARPDELLQPDTLLAETFSARGAPDWSLALPAHGGRIALAAGAQTLGWLDVWGDGTPASVESRRALSDLARLLAVLLAGRGPRAALGA